VDPAPDEASAGPASSGQDAGGVPETGAGAESGATAVTEAGVADGASPSANADAADSGDAGDSSDSGEPDGGEAAVEASSDATVSCYVPSLGLSGQCMLTTDCAALAGYTATPGYCPGPDDVQCCTAP
jgi:hypothetical protein